MNTQKPFFQGSVKQALKSFINSHPNHKTGIFWSLEAIATAVENADNATKSLAVLKKHLPEKFHSLIRFAQPKHIWYLNVEKGVGATQLNIILDELLIKIAKDIGYAPRMKIAVQPSHKRWAQSGFPLVFEQKTTIKLPSEEQATAFIQQFIAQK